MSHYLKCTCLYFYQNSISVQIKGNIRDKKGIVISYLSAFDLADGNLDSVYEVHVISFVESHV